MHQHALNPILQRNRARVTRPARPTQLQQHIAVLEPLELDIPPVLLDCRPHPRLQQLLDHAHHLAVVLVVRQAVLLRHLLALPLPGGDAVLAAGDVDDRLAGADGLGDERKHLGPDVRPVGVGGLGDGDEVLAVEDGGHAVDVHELRGERGGVRRRDGRARVEVLDEGRRDGLGQHAVVREELERVRVRGVFGLDEDGAAGGRGEQRPWPGGWLEARPEGGGAGGKPGVGAGAGVCLSNSAGCGLLEPEACRGSDGAGGVGY